MSDNANLQDREHAQSPTIFHLVPKTNGEVYKIWDFMMPACHPRTGTPNGKFGRVRILAVFPKAPAPLENIKFSIAWCNPEDTKIFTKFRSNQILVGRFVKAFAEFQPNDNTGIVGKVDAIKDFPLAALNALKAIPMWAAGLPKSWDYLQSKKDFAQTARGIQPQRMSQFAMPVQLKASATATVGTVE